MWTDDILMMAYDYQAQKPKFFGKWFERDEFGTAQTITKYENKPQTYASAVAGATARPTVFPPLAFNNTFGVQE